MRSSDPSTCGAEQGVLESKLLRLDEVWSCGSWVLAAGPTSTTEDQQDLKCPLVLRPSHCNNHHSGLAVLQSPSRIEKREGDHVELGSR